MPLARSTCCSTIRCVAPWSAPFLIILALYLIVRAAERPAYALAEKCSGSFRMPGTGEGITVCTSHSDLPGPVDLSAFGIDEASWSANGCFSAWKTNQAYRLVFGGSEAYVCLEPIHY